METKDTVNNEYEYRWEFFNSDGTVGVTKQYFSLCEADISVIPDTSYYHRPHLPSKRPKESE